MDYMALFPFIKGACGIFLRLFVQAKKTEKRLSP
jgi:hypothetical protein